MTPPEHGVPTDDPDDPPDGTATVPASSAKRLLESLDAFVAERAGRTTAAVVPPTDKTAPATLSDQCWIAGVFGALLLVGGLVPESVFDNVRYKEYFEKLLTWFLAGGFLSQWVKSPTHLVTFSRLRHVRYITVATIVASLFLIYDVVRIDATVRPADARVEVDGQPRTDLHFSERLHRLDVKLVPANGGTPRAFSVPVFEQIMSGFHLRPDWRLTSAILINCPPVRCPTPSLLELTLQDGAFDSGVEEDLKKSGATVVDHSRVRVRLEGNGTVTLPTGNYTATLRKDDCSDTLKTFNIPDDSAYDVASAKCR